jgi:hypothetical protein
MRMPVSRPPTSRLGPSDSTAATSSSASVTRTTALRHQRTPMATSTSSSGTPR